MTLSLSTILSILFVLILVGTVVVILTDEKSSSQKLVWILLIAVFPVVGLLLYILLGIDFRRPGYIQRNHKEFLNVLENSDNEFLQNFVKGSDDGLEVDPDYQPLVRLLRQGLASPVTPADDLRIFTSGQEKLESLMADIRAARKYVHMEYFYFRKGRMGTAFRELLMQKAREGVKVRFIRENIANFDISPSYYNEMKKAGVEVVKFTPTFSNLLGLAASLNYRDHRKIVVIDGEIAYTGGMNISDDYYDGWRDTHLRFTGEAVSALQMYFLDAFITSGGRLEGASFAQLFPAVARRQGIDIQGPSGQSLLRPDGQSGPDPALTLAGSGQPAEDAGQPAEDTAKPEADAGNASDEGRTAPSVPVQLVPGDPDTAWPFLTLGLVWILNHAKKYVWLQSPYFMPPESLLDAIKSAALRGVDVRIMMPCHADISLLTPINRSYYLELLRSGVRIFRNDGPFIHSKTFVSDDYVSMVGSCNLDYRSLELSYEMNTYMYGPQMAARSREIFEHDMELCTEIFLEDCEGKHRLRHLWDSVFRLLGPLL